MAFEVLVKFYAKSSESKAQKTFALPVYYRQIMEMIDFRSESDGSYVDYFAEPTRERLLEIVSEYRLKYGKNYPVFGKVIDELKSDTDYEKYEIHLMEWESGMD